MYTSLSLPETFNLILLNVYTVTVAIATYIIIHQYSDLKVT